MQSYSIHLCRSSHNVFGVMSSGVTQKPLLGQIVTGLSQTVRTQDSDFTWEWSISNVLEISLCMSTAERRQRDNSSDLPIMTRIIWYINPAQVLFLLPYVCRQQFAYKACIQVRHICRARILPLVLHFYMNNHQQVGPSKWSQVLGFVLSWHGFKFYNNHTFHMVGFLKPVPY